MKKLILASASPQRKDILKKRGYIFDVIPANIDESCCKENKPAEIVEALSLKKARAVAGRVNRGIVLGSDTIAVLDGKIIGKPRSIEHAEEILKEFSGRKQQVYSGWALVDAETGQEKSGWDVTEIKMKNMSSREIADYVSSGEAMNRAGAYGIQAGGDRFVEKIDGSFDNVVGLPTEKLLPQLNRMLSN